MSPLALSAFLSISCGLCFAVGCFLLLSETDFQKILGVIILGNSTNYYLILSGINDPLNQALVLTAIVISLAILSLLLAYLVKKSQDIEGELHNND